MRLGSSGGFSSGFGSAGLSGADADFALSGDVAVGGGGAGGGVDGGVSHPGGRDPVPRRPTLRSFRIPAGGSGSASGSPGSGSGSATLDVTAGAAGSLPSGTGATMNGGSGASPGGSDAFPLRRGRGSRRSLGAGPPPRGHPIIGMDGPLMRGRCIDEIIAPTAASSAGGAAAVAVSPGSVAATPAAEVRGLPSVPDAVAAFGGGRIFVAARVRPQTALELSEGGVYAVQLGDGAAAVGDGGDGSDGGDGDGGRLLFAATSRVSPLTACRHRPRYHPSAPRIVPPSQAGPSPHSSGHSHTTSS